MSNWVFLEQHRREVGDNEFSGVFEFPLAGQPKRIRVVSMQDTLWESIAICFAHRQPALPTPEEVVQIRRLFWDDKEIVVQFILPVALPAVYLWKSRSHHIDLPKPPFDYWKAIDVSPARPDRAILRSVPFHN